MPKQTEEHIKIWKSNIDTLKEKLKNFTPTIYPNTEYSAVIVDPRKHEDIEVVVKNVMYFLNETSSVNKWGLCIFHTNDNYEFLKSKFKHIPNILYKLVNTSLNNVDDYNSILKTNWFWNSIPTENILIFQPDSILLKHGVDDFLNYKYIGAPWNKTRESRVVGNGGLSFRKKSEMLRIIRENDVNSINPEDIFFSKYLNTTDVPNIEVAGSFSIEDVYFPNPFGIHQPKIEIKKLINILNIGINNIKL